MKMTVTNKSIRVGVLDIAGIGSSSLVLIGDAEAITGYSYFDTPADSLIYNPNIPIYPLNRTGNHTQPGQLCPNEFTKE